MRSVVDEAERVRWDYTPFVSVGPLHFGMSRQQAATAMAAHAFTCDERRTETRSLFLTQRVDFRAVDAPIWSPAVTTYYCDRDILHCLAVDALCGPQVRLDPLRLVGQVPSRLTEQVLDYVTERDLPFAVTGADDATSDELGFMIFAQRAGDVLLSRPFFAKIDERGGIMHDYVPDSEWSRAY